MSAQIMPAHITITAGVSVTSSPEQERYAALNREATQAKKRGDWAIATGTSVTCYIPKKHDSKSHFKDAIMSRSFTIDLRPIRRETLSPHEFLKLQAQNPTLIDRARFVPPRPGGKGFGSFDVSYTRARHRSLAHG